MVLFSSFSHIYLLLMFVYLGLLSGIVFFSCCLLCNNIKNNALIRLKRLKRLKPQLIFAKQQKVPKIPKSHKKNKPNINTLKRLNNLTKGFLKTKQIFNNIYILFVESIKAIILIVVVLISFYINLIYNFGEFRLIYIITWCLFFLFGYIMVKKVAKLFYNFYNKIKQKANKA